MSLQKRLIIAVSVIVTIIGLYFVSQFIVGSVISDTKEIKDTKLTEYQDSIDNLNSQTMGSGYDSDDEYDFGQCLIDNGARFYGSNTCPYCRNQKSMFDDYDVVPYVNCDENRNECIEQGIRLYPTWKIDGSDDLIGVQQLETLSEVTGCKL